MIFLKENNINLKVHGYIRPSGSFFSLKEWEKFCKTFLIMQKEGNSVRGGEIKGSRQFKNLIYNHFFHQLGTEASRYKFLTRKNVLDHVEDFVNHRFWGMEKEYSEYFPNIETLRFAFLYSRGDLEPYVAITEDFTKQFYGKVNNPVTVRHFTTKSGYLRIQNAIKVKNKFDISTYTIATQPFFKKESNVILTLKANLKAAFKSDVKSIALDNGIRAINMYRLSYPGGGENICLNLDSCDDNIETYLWNEYIVTPLQILDVQNLNSEESYNLLNN